MEVGGALWVHFREVEDRTCCDGVRHTRDCDRKERADCVVVTTQLRRGVGSTSSTPSGGIVRLTRYCTMRFPCSYRHALNRGGGVTTGRPTASFHISPQYPDCWGRRYPPTFSRSQRPCQTAGLSPAPPTACGAAVRSDSARELKTTYINMTVNTKIPASS